MTADQYDSPAGVLLLLDEERALLQRLLPRGAKLLLLDEEQVPKPPSKAVARVERTASQNTRVGRPPRKAPVAASKQPTVAPPAPAGLRRSAREHRKVPAWWHLVEELEKPREQRAPQKRLTKPADLQKCPHGQSMETQTFQYSSTREPRRRNGAKDKSEVERVLSGSEDKRKDKRPRGRTGTKDLERHDVSNEAALNGGHADAVGSHQAVSQQEKGQLQAKLDKLDNDQLDRVIDFLKLDMGDNLEGQEIQLDLDTLPPARRRALIKFVDDELCKACGARARTACSADVAAGVPSMSPAFPTMEAGATPLAAATPVAAALTPRREPEAAGPAACAAKRQLAWEVCSAREVQRQSHLREVREAASVGGTPQSLTPAAAEPAPGGGLAAMPEMMLPPAAEAGAQQPPAPPQAARAAGPASAEASAQPAARPAAAAEAPGAAAAAPRAFPASGDSMLESTAEVLDMVDFGWM